MNEALARRVSERADLRGIALPDSLHGPLLTYLDLLYRWNAKINLTSLSDYDEAIDRLLLEPLAASTALPRNVRLMDLGSGGGSPAIPLALAIDASDLVMVESRGRKAAFLREAARAVGIPASVEAVRFEELSTRGKYASAEDIVSMRALRMDGLSLKAAVPFLKPTGILALFVSAGAPLPSLHELPSADRRTLFNSAELVLLRRDVPRGTLQGAEAQL